MNRNSLVAALSETQGWISNPDPSPGNVTVGSGKILPSSDGLYRLVVTNAVTGERRTLPDPLNAGLFLSLSLYRTAGATLTVTAATQVDAAGHTNMQFSAAEQNIMLLSVPTALGGGAGKFRWEIMSNDGVALS